MLTPASDIAAKASADRPPFVRKIAYSKNLPGKLPSETPRWAASGIDSQGSRGLRNGFAELLKHLRGSSAQILDRPGGCFDVQVSVVRHSGTEGGDAEPRPKVPETKRSCPIPEFFEKER